jgi:hypothetical protein
VFDTFPWPQTPTLAQAKAVALRTLQRKVMKANGWTLRDLYRTLEERGANPLRDAHDELDTAVRAASGTKPRRDPLAFLLQLNEELAAREAAGEPVTPPGPPPSVSDPGPFVTHIACNPHRYRASLPTGKTFCRECTIGTTLKAATYPWTRTG